MGVWGGHWRSSMSLPAFPPSHSSLLAVYWTPAPCPVPGPGVLQGKGTGTSTGYVQVPTAGEGSGVDPELGVAHRRAQIRGALLAAGP